MIRFLAGLFIGGTLAVAAYIELSARRGVPAGPLNDNGCHPGCSLCAVLDDWATDPRTAELATGGGQEGAK